MTIAPISGPIDLNNQVAIVTGAAGGLGQAICCSLAREGANVAVIDLKPAEETLKKINVYGGQNMALRCDLTNKTGVIQTVDEIVKTYGKIDILVNCAGIAYLTKLPDISEEEWDKQFLVNVKGYFLITQAVFAIMKKQNCGKIVNVGSLAGRAAGVAAGPHYSAAKGAVHTFTKWVAKYSGPFGINVNCVVPGPCETEMTKDFPPGSKAPEKFPLGRPGEPEDIAEAVLFLSSQAANYITGVLLDVNGGIFMP